MSTAALVLALVALGGLGLLAVAVRAHLAEADRRLTELATRYAQLVAPPPIGRAPGEVDAELEAQVGHVAAWAPWRFGQAAAPGHLAGIAPRPWSLGLPIDESLPTSVQVSPAHEAGDRDDFEVEDAEPAPGVRGAHPRADREEDTLP